MRATTLSLFLTLTTCACSSAQQRDPGDLPGITLELPPALDAERGWFAEQITLAEARVRTWFTGAGHSLAGQVLVERATVFSDLAAARPLVARACGAEPGQIPDSFSGTVCGSELLLIDRAAFQRNYERLYPDLPWTDGEYGRLVTHELAHRGHALVARRLFGSEDGMGPRWFFEGLAIQVAGQFPGPVEHTDENGVTRPMDFAAFSKRVAQDGHKVLSYPIYANMFRYLSSLIPAEGLIRQAGEPDFMVWLAKRVGQVEADRS